jgi:hypothetical protein
MDWNFGQMPFIHEPTGYQHVATNNLPEPTIKNGKEHFGILTYAAPGSPSYPITIDGSGGNNGTGELKFGTTPDFVWIKMTNGSQNNILFNSVRGKTKSLRSDSNISEVTTRSNFDFATDGFTISATDGETYQQNDSYVAWCWKAGGSSTVSNSNGSEASSVSANTDAGFSIVQWTPDDAAGTVGHGLSAPPQFILVKGLDASAWYVYHEGNAATHYLSLSADFGAAASSAVWNNTAPTNTVFSVGSVGNADRGGNPAVAFCWHSVEGYSKIGKYNGGSGGGSAPDLDGAFVRTGFRPAWLLVKRVNADGDPWIILDSTRDPSNFAFRGQQPNNAVADPTSGDSYACDFLANGFKWRTANAGVNNASATYVYLCFAENPFGGENAPPATAR